MRKSNAAGFIKNQVTSASLPNHVIFIKSLGKAEGFRRLPHKLAVIYQTEKCTQKSGEGGVFFLLKNRMSRVEWRSEK